MATKKTSTKPVKTAAKKTAKKVAVKADKRTTEQTSKYNHLEKMSTKQ